MTIPVLMCIDVEPDKFKIDIDAREPWLGFERTFKFFDDLRARFQSATGRPVQYSWFLRMDPQIELGYGSADWVVRRYRSLIDKLISAGDAVGLHVHAWQWHESSRSWEVELGDQSWLEHCVKVGFEAFEASLKRRCRYFRFGDSFTNEGILALVEQLGAQFELTPEPGHLADTIPHSLTPISFDTTHMPRWPYHPSRSDFQELDPTGNRELWVIPLTTGSVDWAGEVNGHSHHASRRPDSRQMNGHTCEGCLERVDGEFIAGWAYDAARPDDQLEVEVFADDVLVATSLASIFRTDVFAAGKGNGRHCFTVNVPSVLANGKQHVISARVKGTSYNLINSPLELKTTRQGIETTGLHLNYNTWPVCRLIDNTLNGPNPYLGMVVRSDVIMKPDQCSNMEQTVKYILSLGNMAFTTPREFIATFPENLKNATAG